MDNLYCDTCHMEVPYAHSNHPGDNCLTEVEDGVCNGHLLIARSRRVIDKKATAGSQKPQLHLMPPTAMIQCCKAFSDGAKKYGPFNWRDKKLDRDVYFGAILRHTFALMDGEACASDSGLNHLAHIMATCAILLDNEIHNGETRTE